jgi:hypothetical protein
MRMELKKLATLTFDKNVGAVDRIFRLASGAGLVAAGWYLGLPIWVCIAMTVFGVMWTATGILSKCSIYYVLGYSTCPINGSANPLRRPTAGGSR